MNDDATLLGIYQASLLLVPLIQPAAFHGNHNDDYDDLLTIFAFNNA